MERRLLLAGLGGAIAQAGCAATALSPIAGIGEGNGDVEETIRQLDGTMAALRSGRIETIARAVEKRSGADAKRAEHVLRTAFRSMTVAGAFRGLSYEDRFHPGVQARVRASLPEIEEAVGVARALVAGLSPRDRRALRDAVREDPELPARLFGDIDAEAASGGVPLGQRLLMRRVVQHVSMRLRQSPDHLLDETEERLRRLETRADAERFEQQTAVAQAAEAAIFRDAPQVLAARRSWEGRTIASAVPPAGIYGLISDPSVILVSDGKPNRDERWEAERKKHKGAYLLGFGIANLAMFGVLVIPTNIFVLIPANPTPGVVAIITGIVLMVQGGSKLRALEERGG